MFDKKIVYTSNGLSTFPCLADKYYLFILFF